jgi:hypothetical protein
MPRRSRPAARNVPFETAIALAGSRARLLASVNRSTAANWPARGVPWNVLGPILREQLEANGGRTVVPRTPEALAAHRELEALALTTHGRGARWRAARVLLRSLTRRRQ